MAVGALEPKFYKEFTALLGPPEHVAALRDRPDDWPELRTAIATAFKTATRGESEAIFEGTDACVAPVLSLSEAASHRHLAARETFIGVAGVVQPAPRFSRTPAAKPTPPPVVGADTRQVLSDWGAEYLDGHLCDGVVQSG